MPKIHTGCSQGELEWDMLRLGRPTASEFDQILTPEFRARTGEMPKSYLARKIAEKWYGKPLVGFSTWATEQGEFLEQEARPFYELEYGEEVKRVAFVETDDGRCGCSPDGLIGDDGGIEIKCPEAHTHVGYLLRGELPKDYVMQVHGSLYVTGRKWWRFFSYRRKFPPLLLTVERDEEIMEKIDAALQTFYREFDLALEKINQLR